MEIRSHFRLSKDRDAGRGKNLGVPVVIGENNLPSSIGIWLNVRPDIWGASGPAPPVPAPLKESEALAL